MKYSLTIFLALLALTFSAVGVKPVYAATLIVTSTVDSGAGSLRNTIASAASGDIITFSAALSGGTIYLASTLTLSKNVTIDGSALASKITISGDTDNNGIGDVRVFSVNSGVNATLNSLIITKGAVTVSSYLGDAGGGILNNGSMLTVANSTLSGNSSTGGGGGIFNGNGTLTVTNSTLSGNSATYGGGIYKVVGVLTVTNSILSSNSASFGGGIHNYAGALTITNSTFSGNSAVTSGGGIYNSGTLTATNSTISSNSALYGGGILNYGGTLTLASSGLSSNSASSEGGGILNSGSAVAVTSSALSSNSASSEGGDVLNYGGDFTTNALSGNSVAATSVGSGKLTVSSSTLSNNSAPYGGGIWSDGVLTVTNSTLASNSATISGGGISSPGTLTVTNSTFSGNSATSGGGGGVWSGNALTVTNSTFSGNSTIYGGGIYHYAGTLTVMNSTLSGNSATGGGGIAKYSGTLNYANTIIANSISGGDCALSTGGVIGINTNNLVEDGSCSASLTGDPKLGVLAGNGGSTQTFALTANAGIPSPAINAGYLATCAATDQRGVARPQGSKCDIGSYELRASDAATPTVAAITLVDANPTNAETVNYIVVFSESVTGVDPTDFKTTNTLTTNTVVTNVTGGGTTYNVTTTTGTGNGTTRLDVPAAAELYNATGYPLLTPYNSGQTYMVYKGTAPTVPVLKTPLTGVLVTTTPTLTWNASSEVMALMVNPWSYEVNVATLDGYNHTFNTASGLENTSLSDWSAAPLSPNTTYTWKVRACNDANQYSAWSLTRTFRTKLATPVLNLPANSDTLNNKRPTFEWDAAEGASGYTIQVLKKNPATGLFTVISNTFTVTGATYAYTPTVDLLPGMEYQWRVKANGLNAGDYSALFTFTTSANPPKTPVQSLPATGTSILSTATGTELKWVAPLSAGLLAVPLTYYPLATGYDVQVSTNAGFANISPTTNNVKTLNVGTTSTTLSAVLATVTAPDDVIRPGRTYYWRVRSISAAGNYSAWSAARTILVKFNAPTLVSPADLATGVSRTAPTFTWSSGDNGIWTSYTIQLATTPPTAATFAVVKSFTLIMAPKQTYTAALTTTTRLLGSKTYYWRVQINGIYTPIFSIQNYLTSRRFTTAP